ncbi:MAG: fumarylacetoacetate hydrolase family protein [Ktedonobacteraceae bacterium]
MRLVTFSIDNAVHLGALMGEQVLDLPGAYIAWQRMSDDARAHVSGQQDFPQSVIEFLQASDTMKAGAARLLTFIANPEHTAQFVSAGVVHAASAVSFLPPIPRPGKVVCLGHNYRRHIAEMGSAMPQYPVLFAKFSNTLIGHRQPIVLPKISQMVDYEAELALVIGKRGKDIPQTPEAFEYLAGYTIFNDVSVRDFQRRTVQWMQGKNFDGSGPIGPAIVTRDDIADPNAFDLMLRLNGEVMQQANTSDFIFDIPTILSYISQIMTLEPGDIIATGTPSGVGSARKPPVFLKPGDNVQVEIAGLGVLENPVVES